ncbi:MULTISPECIES: hypothetical protein [Mangrovibacter]|uniref:hypothetical protein n=1 Tax=Mangrovibacter TaxID=451512 RepID=UPI0004D9C1D5|nr:MULTISPECIES: hypothetical protein [Mangrovibacter]KEA51481.1 hypothetical protein DT73_17360 [Mangrovibacter sp. MFB070]
MAKVTKNGTLRVNAVTRLVIFVKFSPQMQARAQQSISQGAMGLSAGGISSIIAAFFHPVVAISQRCGAFFSN